MEVGFWGLEEGPGTCDSAQSGRPPTDRNIKPARAAFQLSHPRPRGPWMPARSSQTTQPLLQASPCCPVLLPGLIPAEAGQLGALKVCS